MRREEFVALQRFWDEKLRKAGFKDIETRTWDGKDAQLKTSSIIHPRALSRWRSGSEFVARIMTFCRDAPARYFKEPFRDRMILRLHAEGWTLAQIAAKCSRMDGIYRGKHYCFRRIKRTKLAVVQWWNENKHLYEGGSEEF